LKILLGLQAEESGVEKYAWNLTVLQKTIFIALQTKFVKNMCRFLQGVQVQIIFFVSLAYKRGTSGEPR